MDAVTIEQRRRELDAAVDAAVAEREAVLAKMSPDDRLAFVERRVSGPFPGRRPLTAREREATALADAFRAAQAAEVEARGERTRFRKATGSATRPTPARAPARG